MPTNTPGTPDARGLVRLIAGMSIEGECETHHHDYVDCRDSGGCCDDNDTCEAYAPSDYDAEVDTLYQLIATARAVPTETKPCGHAPHHSHTMSPTRELCPGVSFQEAYLFAEQDAALLADMLKAEQDAALLADMLKQAVAENKRLRANLSSRLAAE